MSTKIIVFTDLAKCAVLKIFPLHITYVHTYILVEQLARWQLWWKMLLSRPKHYLHHTVIHFTCLKDRYIVSLFVKEPASTKCHHLGTSHDHIRADKWHTRVMRLHNCTIVKGQPQLVDSGQITNHHPPLTSLCSTTVLEAYSNENDSNCIIEDSTVQSVMPHME